MNARRHPTGFTLMEMMVAVLASSIVITAVVGAAVAQQRAFYASEKTRAAQSSARAAQLFIQEKLRLAGFGMDPALAFDFGFYTPTKYPSFPCPSEAAGCARDATDANDELVFYARNPNYWVPNALTGNPVGRAWRIRGTAAPDSTTTPVGNNSITVDATKGDVFAKGQILAAVCPNGQYYAYMTVATTTTVSDDGATSIPLLDADTSNPFRRQDLALTSGSQDTPAYFDTAGGLASSPKPAACFSSGQARLFQIDRYRFHVRPVEVGSLTPGKKKYDPYLMLDMGVDTNGDDKIDASDEMVIAEGVEIFQVAYGLANPALTTPLVGANAGKPILFTPGLPGGSTVAEQLTTTKIPPTLPLGFSFAPTLSASDNPYAPWSWYRYSLTPPLPANHPRMTDAQGNIRTVQVAMVVRSPEPDLQAKASIVLDGNFTLLNLKTVPAWIQTNAYPDAEHDGYQRLQVQSTVLVPNMTIRGMTFF